MSKYPDELTCDMVEAYGVFDIKSLPARLAATLAVGLRDDSRVKKAITGTKTDDKTILLAVIADCMQWLQWSRTEDGLKGQNKPKSFLRYYMGYKDPEPEHEIFDSPEAFWERLEELTR